MTKYLYLYLSTVKNLSVAVLDFVLQTFLRAPMGGFIPYQGVPEISIDLDTDGIEKMMG